VAPLLAVNDLSRSFGGLAAVSGLDFAVERGEVLGLIGPNGAGKTTVFNLISGVLPPTRGRVRFKGADITGCSPHAIARLGLVRTFQIPTLFRSFSALDNILLGAYPLLRRHPLDLIRRRRVDGDETGVRERAREILGTFRLDAMRDESVSNLPHGDQKKIELAVALAGSPEMLLLDEPFAGLNANEIEDMTGHLERLRRAAVTFIVVEHNMRALMRIADRVVVLNFGRKIAEGAPKDISTNAEVIRAYLGTKRHAARG
jgi:branched-chain amino acid transport system ATP-binding protein